MFQKIKNVYHLFIAMCANIFFGFPGKKITIIGVTGTDGKTTTASIIYHILKSNNNKASLLTSLGARIGDKDFDTGFHVTTPSPFALQRLLKKANDSGSEYFVLEVTSHAIDQFRVWGIPFKVAILTNISNEHLDYHKTYENYANTKFKLLKRAQIVILNKSDKSYKFFEDEKKFESLNNKFTYGLTNDVDFKESDFNFNTKNLKGEFNKLNALAASACCRLLDLDDSQINKSLGSFKMPTGRFDFVYEKEYSVLIDFAHTPNAFEEVLRTVKPNVKGKIIHVFGSAGERDKEKRPQLGQVSSKYSDMLILTAEDPRNEDVDDIIDEISVGIEKKSKILRISDRKLAIKTGIDMAGAGDLILITGKSHEKSMTFGNKDIPWDEYDIAKKAIKDKKNGKNK